MGVCYKNCKKCEVSEGNNGGNLVGRTYKAQLPCGKFRMDSNLLIDINLQNEFMNNCLERAKKISRKYYTVSRFYDPEDIVQEVMWKVIRQNISYDASTGKSLQAFARMLVDNKYTDLARKVNSEFVIGKEDIVDECGDIVQQNVVANLVSMESVVGEDMTLGDTLSDESNLEDIVGNKSAIDNFLDNVPSTYDEFFTTRTPMRDADGNPVKDEKGHIIYVNTGVKVSLREVMELVFDGLTLKEISKYMGVTSSVISKVIDNSRDELKTTCKDLGFVI
jgi:RNA polymerase sigma factor (sigma-70 family)